MKIANLSARLPQDLNIKIHSLLSRSFLNLEERNSACVELLSPTSIYAKIKDLGEPSDREYLQTCQKVAHLVQIMKQSDLVSNEEGFVFQERDITHLKKEFSKCIEELRIAILQAQPKAPENVKVIESIKETLKEEALYDEDALREYLSNPANIESKNINKEFLKKFPNVCKILEIELEKMRDGFYGDEIKGLVENLDPTILAEEKIKGFLILVVLICPYIRDTKDMCEKSILEKAKEEITTLTRSPNDLADFEEAFFDELSKLPINLTALRTNGFDKATFIALIQEYITGNEVNQKAHLHFQRIREPLNQFISRFSFFTRGRYRSVPQEISPRSGARQIYQRAVAPFVKSILVSEKMRDEFMLEAIKELDSELVNLQNELNALNASNPGIARFQWNVNRRLFNSDTENEAALQQLVHLRLENSEDGADIKLSDSEDEASTNLSDTDDVFSSDDESIVPLMTAKRALTDQIQSKITVIQSILIELLIRKNRKGFFDHVKLIHPQFIKKVIEPILEAFCETNEYEQAVTTIKALKVKSSVKDDLYASIVNNDSFLDINFIDILLQVVGLIEDPGTQAKVLSGQRSFLPQSIRERKPSLVCGCVETLSNLEVTSDGFESQFNRFKNLLVAAADLGITSLINDAFRYIEALEDDQFREILKIKLLRERVFVRDSLDCFFSALETIQDESTKRETIKQVDHTYLRFLVAVESSQDKMELLKIKDGGSHSSAKLLNLYLENEFYTEAYRLIHQGIAPSSSILVYEFALDTIYKQQQDAGAALAIIGLCGQEEEVVQRTLGKEFAFRLMQELLKDKKDISQLQASLHFSSTDLVLLHLLNADLSLNETQRLPSKEKQEILKKLSKTTLNKETYLLVIDFLIKFQSLKLQSSKQEVADEALVNSVIDLIEAVIQSADSTKRLVIAKTKDMLYLSLVKYLVLAGKIPASYDFTPLVKLEKKISRESEMREVSDFVSNYFSRFYRTAPNDNTFEDHLAFIAFQRKNPGWFKDVKAYKKVQKAVNQSSSINGKIRKIEAIAIRVLVNFATHQDFKGFEPYKVIAPAILDQISNVSHKKAIANQLSGSRISWTPEVHEDDLI